MHLLSSWARRSAESPGWVIAILLVTIVASVFLTFRLQISTDISLLIPQHSRVSGALLEALDDFGTTDRLVVLISSNKTPDGTPAASRQMLKEYASNLADGMDDSGLFENLAYRVTPAQRSFIEDLYFRHPFHYHSTEDLEGIEQTLVPSVVDQRITDLARTIRTSPFSAATGQQLTRDPLGFRREYRIGNSQDNLTGFKLDLSDGHFFTLDGRSILLIARPNEPSQDTGFDQLLLNELERIIAKLDPSGAPASFHADYSINASPAIGVQLLGPYVETLSGSQTAQKEILPSIAITILGLLILFAWVYRSLAGLLILAVPLFTAILVTAATASVFAGQLTMISVGFVAILVGLGVDFGIHLMERIAQESTHGEAMRESIARAFGTTGRGVLIGAVTTAAIFLLIASSDFGALRQFGWIIAVGIGLTLIAMITLLPVLIQRFPDSLRIRNLRTDPSNAQSWALWVVAHYRGVIALGVALTFVLGLTASGLRIESNVYELGPINSGYEHKKSSFLQRAGGSTNVVMLVAEHENLEELLKLSERTKAALQTLQANNEIDSFESLSSLLPSRSSQMETIATVGNWDLNAAMTSLRDSLSMNGFRTAAFEPFVETVLAYEAGRPLDEGLIVSLEAFKGTPAEQWLERYLDHDDNRWKSVTYVYPRPGLWEDAVPASIVEDLERPGESVVLTGIVPSFNETANFIAREFARLSFAALFVVLIVAMLFFRRPSLSALAAIPAVAGLIWTLGLMKVLGIELNLVSMLVAPLIVGLGIDDAVHVLNRYREGTGTLAENMAAVSRPIAMTTATTVIGFGSLALADLPSLQSMGITVSIGMVCCAVTSLVMLPALLIAVDARR